VRHLLTPLNSFGSPLGNQPPKN